MPSIFKIIKGFKAKIRLATSDSLVVWGRHAERINKGATAPVRGAEGHVGKVWGSGISQTPAELE